eukprot:scaffold2767_cov177-Amphora_coffeaeformis.AAC.48
MNLRFRRIFADVLTGSRGPSIGFVPPRRRKISPPHVFHTAKTPWPRFSSQQSSNNKPTELDTPYFKDTSQPSTSFPLSKMAVSAWKCAANERMAVTELRIERM